LPLKKLSITDSEAEKIKELVSKGFSGVKIAKAIKKPQVTIWRNMELLGVNNKKNNNKPPPRDDIFNWSDFDNSVI
jgi:IS30 family transposase